MGTSATVETTRSKEGIISDTKEGESCRGIDHNHIVENRRYSMLPFLLPLSHRPDIGDLTSSHCTLRWGPYAQCQPHL